MPTAKELDDSRREHLRGYRSGMDDARDDTYGVRLESPVLPDFGRGYNDGYNDERAARASILCPDC